MTGCGNSAFLLILAASAAFAAGGALPQYLERSLREGRAAYYREDYAESLRFAMEVIVENPANPEARELMRKSAAALVALEIRQVQEERKLLLREARETQVGRKKDKKALDTTKRKESNEFQARLAKAESEHPDWTGRMNARIAGGEYLEAYQFAYQVRDEFPQEVWWAVEIDRLGRILEREKGSASSRPHWYEDALAGYRDFSSKRWGEAAQVWRKALASAGGAANLPEQVMRRRILEAERLGHIPSEPFPSKPAAPSPAAASVTLPAAVSVAPPAEPAKPVLPKPRHVRRRVPVVIKPEAPKPPPAPPPDAKAVEALYVRGLVQYGTGQVRAAASTWEEVLRLDPRHAAARRALERAGKELEGKP